MAPGVGEELIGTVGHLSVYGVLSDGRVILQCLFFEVDAGGESPRVATRTLLLGVDANGPPSAALRDTYLSSSDRDEEERVKRFGERNVALAHLLTRSNDVVAVLSRTFVPVAVRVANGVEIVSARFLDRPPSGFYEILATLDVARMRAVGGYLGGSPAAVASSSSVEDQARETLERYVTHANKKLRRGCGTRELAFSIRVHGRKVVFDSSVSGADAERVIGELFSVRDVTFACRSLRLVTPRGFVAVAFADDQCLLLLREAVFSLFRHIYADFSGLRPVFDFLGPNLYREGGPRSVFFPGFPNLSVYSVPWGRRLAQETCRDAIDGILSECGLPEILGAAGKHSLSLVSPPPTGLSEDEMGIFFSNVSPRLRLNGNHFSDHETSDAEVVNIYAGDRDLYRVTIPGLRAEILRRCVGWRDFPLVFGDRGRGESVTEDEPSADVCARFVERLRHRSGRLYVYIRCLEGFLSHHVTSACASSGLPWVMVRNDNEFYVGEDARGQSGCVETCIRTVFGCYWRRLFGALDREPRCLVTGRGPSLLLVAGDTLFGPFGLSGAGPGRCVHWTDVAGRFLSDCVSAVFRDTESSGLEGSLRDKMRDVLLQLAARRHEVSFWAERFLPGKHAVEEHSGVLDCNVFSGVWLPRGRVAVQSLETALHDAVDYEGYVRKIFSYMRLCLSVAVRRRGLTVRVGREDEREVEEFDGAALVEAVASWERRLLNDYTVLFRINS